MEALEQYWGYILIFLMLILSSVISRSIKKVYDIYSLHSTSAGYTGRQTAETILESNGVEGVCIYPAGSVLSDSYNQKQKIISLSENNYSGSSVSAVAFAAHEAGHALQAAEKYTPVTILVVMKPLVRIASALFFPLIFFGALAHIAIGTDIIYYFFAAILFLQLLTIPVEINANRRALKRA